MMGDHILSVPLFEVGRLWINATCELSRRTLEAVMAIQPDFSSPYFYGITTVFVYVLYRLYDLFFVPINRVRMLGDVGYVPESSKMTMKEMANVVRKRRLVGEIPPVYPNGWFVVIESRDLKAGEVKNVSCLGKNLAVFRGEDGRSFVIDAYCPHMGANLAVGGIVKGSCLECPFHGWQFRGDDGKCVHIPYLDQESSIPDVAKVTSYSTLERNGFVYIWFHAEGIDPNWEPPEIEEISRGEWTYRGRSEHIINAHIEEVPENGSDVAHLSHLHGPIMTAGVDLRFTYSKYWSFAKHSWNGKWNQDPEPDRKHVGIMELLHSIKLCGVEFPILDMKIVAQQIGPGIVNLTFESMFGRGAYLQALTPVEPITQRMIHHVYFQRSTPTIVGKFFLLGEALMIGPAIVYLTYESPIFGRGAFVQSLTPIEPLRQRMIHHIYANNYTPTLVAKFYLFAEALMVERDIMIWNNKRYMAKPMFIKSKEDALVARHRRWYSQFYSENSPRLKFSSDSLEW